MHRKQNSDIYTNRGATVVKGLITHGSGTVGFILVGRVSEKPLIILELGAQKGRWVMEQAFHGDFRLVLHGFFGRFSSFLD